MSKSKYVLEKVMPLDSNIAIFHEEGGLARKMLTHDDTVLCHCEGTSKDIRMCLQLIDTISTATHHGRAVQECAVTGRENLDKKI